MNLPVKPIDSWSRGIRRRLLVEPTFESPQPNRQLVKRNSPSSSGGTDLRISSPSLLLEMEVQPNGTIVAAEVGSSGVAECSRRWLIHFSFRLNDLANRPHRQPKQKSLAVDALEPEAPTPAGLTFVRLFAGHRVVQECTNHERPSLCHSSGTVPSSKSGPSESGEGLDEEKDRSFGCVFLLPSPGATLCETWLGSVRRLGKSFQTLEPLHRIDDATGSKVTDDQEEADDEPRTGPESTKLPQSIVASSFSCNKQTKCTIARHLVECTTMM
ncbi:unnamed protein product [Protopolystoma xenopodis]|uniref:Uncharacterized protein n=1 Tax=Protopolystoma xenopodis TaxID=117903 RepID=A0A3S5BQJ3_9PLAT|nr:unnamed protein product [Protopolystoma xenopodis]